MKRQTSHVHLARWLHIGVWILLLVIYKKTFFFFIIFLVFASGFGSGLGGVLGTATIGLFLLGLGMYLNRSASRIGGTVSAGVPEHLGIMILGLTGFSVVTIIIMAH